MNINSGNYLELLQRWLKHAEKAIYQPSWNSEVASYGPGNRGHWAQQTNNTAFGAFAVAAADPDFDAEKTGISQAKVLDYALKMLRFTLRSHVSGPDTTFDGQSWGQSWISVLCVERMMHGVDAIAEHLTPGDHESLRNMLISESNWMLDEYSVEADIDATTGKNRPESNIWNGSVLHRTAMMYPDAPRAAEYREKGTKFLLNGISIPADANSDEIIDGKKVSEWFVGANFTETYGLNHHAYMNVGYMVICLSNIAMLHFSGKKRGITLTPALYQHAHELWQHIRKLTFDDGRLWRIGGDSRVRYCYCQDYAIPMWLLAQDLWNDTDATAFEAGWLKQVEMEMNHNGDGSFLSDRLKELEEVSPLYFHRLEGDKAVTLSMGAYWRRIFNNMKTTAVPEIAPISSSWYDEYHGAMMQRGTNRMASFIWKSAEKPMAMCLPPDDSSMAEWHWNLIGEIKGTAVCNTTNILEHTDHVFSGGFNTCGKFEWLCKEHVAEGQADEETANEEIAFAALPDDSTVLIMQRATTINRTWLKSVKGLFCNMPNDLFNSMTRTYNSTELHGLPGKAEQINLNAKHVCIDKKLDIELLYGADSLIINRPASRQIKILSNRPSGGNLYCDEICAPCILDRKDYEAETCLFDLGFVITAGQIQEDSFKLSGQQNNIRWTGITGADGYRYLFIAAFSNKETAEIELPGNTSAIRLDTEETYPLDSGILTVTLKNYDSAVYRLS